MINAGSYFAISSVFFVYIFIVIIIGIGASFLVKNLSDYTLAGRHLSGALTALGAGASDMSAWLLMALPGAVFILGINQIWLPIGLAIGAYLNWQFEAKRLRIFTEVANNSLTIPAFLTNRFLDKGKALRLVTGMVTIAFFTVYLSANFMAGAYLIEYVLGFNYITGVLFGASVIVIYTCVGGFWSVTWIDFFQGTLMFFALLIVPAITMNHLEGFSAALTSLSSNGQQYFDAFHGLTFIGLISLMGWGLGYFGQPHIIMRFMAARSSQEIPIARFICMTWMILAMYGAIFTGIFGAAYMHSEGSTLAVPENIFIILAEVLFNPWIAGVLIAAVMSAILNTGSAQLLAAATSLAEDFYYPFFRPTASQREMMIMVRVAVVVIAVIAGIIALNADKSLLRLVGYAWAGLGASFGPVILFSLYWKRMTRNAAIAGMIVGASTAIIWELVNERLHIIFSIYSLVPGFILSCITIYFVSILGAKPEKAIIDQFDEAMKQIKK